jgi:hypothetical protein
MMRTSIFIFLILLAFESQAQYCIPEGFHSELGSAKDFFSKKIPLDDVDWSTQLISGPQLDTIFIKKPHPSDSGFDCVQDTSSFKYMVNRVVGERQYTLWQPYGKSEPFGVTFGYQYHLSGTERDSTRNILNLTGGNQFILLALTNTSLVDIKVNVAMLDSMGHRINSIQDQEVWCLVPSGASLDTLLNFNYHAYFTEHKFDSCGIEISPPLQSFHSFDPSIVSGVEFRVVDARQVSQDGNKSPALAACTFSLIKFHIGTLVLCGGLADDFVPSHKKNVMPNPIQSGNLKFEEDKHIKVLDIMGHVVYASETASQINVDGWVKGVYLLQTSTGSARFIVE